MPDEIGHVGYPDVNVTELAERMDRFSDPREDGGSTGVPISNVVDQQEYTSMRGKSPQECLSLLNVMPLEVMDYILAFAPSSILFQVRGVCKVFSTFISRRTFLQARAELRPFECPLSPLSFIVEKGNWQAVGLDNQAHLMEDQKYGKNFHHSHLHRSIQIS